MEQNNDNSKTVVFDPLTEEEDLEMLHKLSVNKKKAEAYSYDEDEQDDDDGEDDKNSGNGILIGLVIVLVILFIGAIIWGTMVFNKINKEEEEKNTSPQSSVQVTDEEREEEEPAEEEDEKSDCKIYFKSDSVEEKDDGYTVRAIFVDKAGKYYTERVTIDKDTEIREDGVKFSYRTFISIIKSLGSKEVEFKGIVNHSDLHVDLIEYKKEILEEKEEEGIVLEEEADIQEPVAEQ